MSTMSAHPPRPSFWSSLKAFLVNAGGAFREGVELEKIRSAYRAAGHVNPNLAAEQEIYLRGEYLERFRDLASDAYMKDGTDLEEVKTAFIKDRLMAKTTILDAQTTASVRAVIRDMGPDEAYHTAVYEQWQYDMKRWLKEIKAEAEREFGKGGYTPLERRVLRSRE